MNCERTRSLLGAHLDGELDAVNDRDFQEHLRECPRCLNAVSQQESLRQMVRQAAPYHRAPAGLEAQVRAALRGQPAFRQEQAPRAAPSIRRPAWWQQWAVAMATIVAVVIAGWIGSEVAARRAASEFLAEELITAHVRSLQGTHLTDVPSSDQHTVKPWFAGKTDFAPPVRDLAGDGFPLIGGRLEYVAGHSAAALVYQRNKHFINVFIWPEAAGAAPSGDSLTRRGYNIVSWEQGQLRFCAVSDLNTGELQAFAARFRENR
jgi:anti-sigma factor RsiW